MQLNMNVGVKGRVLLCKRVNGVDIPILPEFDNLILDALITNVYARNVSSNLSRSNVGAGGGIGSSFRVGAGSTAPSPEDVALVSPLLFTANCSVTASNTTYDAGTDTYSLTQTTRGEFAAATSEVNLSELAVYTNNVGTNTAALPILSRTLIKNGLGEPTTLTLAVGEILVIYYTFTCITPRTLVSEKVIDGVPTTITMVYHVAGASSYFYYPFALRRGNLGAQSAAVAFRSSSFTFPSAFSALSTTGWVSQNAGISARTPISPGTGMPQRDRINLAFANSPTLTGLLFPETFNSYGIGWLFQFSPSFVKTDQFVIDIQTLTTITRL